MQLTVTWYENRHVGTQETHWDKTNKKVRDFAGYVLITFLCFDLNSRADAMRLAADVTRLALEVLFVLSVGPKAQLALCEEIQLPSGEQQTGMRCDIL